MRDVGLLLLRVIIGGLFMLHGYPKLFGGPGKPVYPRLQRHLGPGFAQFMEHGGIHNFRATVERIGVPMPHLMAWVAALSEFVGGGLLILGWLTRPAALLLCGNMGVAISRVHWRTGLMGQGGYELALALLAGLLGILFAGPGAISIDGDS